MPANLVNSTVATGLEMFSFHSNPKERQCQRTLKLLHSCAQFTCYKVMLKILRARLQQYMNWELPDIQAGFRKDRGTRDKIANIRWIIQKGREFQKNIYCFIDHAKAFDYVAHSILWRILTEMEMPDHLTASWETCIQVKNQQLELDMEYQTSSKLGKYIKAVYCYPVYLTSVQSRSSEMPGWMKHKLESQLPGEMLITSDIQMTPP